MSFAGAWIPQAAAIPVRDGQVCLVTASSGRRWVIPKGIIDPGQTAPETALQEAWEEAGLVGTLVPEPVGHYLRDKWGGTCHITVFLMHVTEAHENWPEKAARQRRWLSPSQALDLIRDEDLREILRGVLAVGGGPS